MAVIYLAIGAAICEVLFVFYSYPNDDMVMATFDRTVRQYGIRISAVVRGKSLVSIHDWLKQVTHIC